MSLGQQALQNGITGFFTAAVIYAIPVILAICAGISALIIKSGIRKMHKQKSTVEARNAARKKAGRLASAYLSENTSATVFKSTSNEKTLLGTEVEVFDPQIAMYFQGNLRYDNDLMQILPDNIVIRYENMKSVQCKEFNDWKSSYYVRTKENVVYIVYFPEHYESGQDNPAADFQKKAKTAIQRADT